MSKGNEMDWLKKLKDYAPDIAMAVASGGATLPQLALKAVADAVRVDIKDKTDLASVVTGATPEAMLKIKQANNDYLLKKMQLELNDMQTEHKTTQETIRNGDNSADQVVRHTRPTMAKQSWTATILYCMGCFGVHAIADRNLFDIYIAGILSAPAWAYLGLRTTDKITEASKSWGKK